MNRNHDYDYGGYIPMAAIQNLEAVVKKLRDLAAKASKDDNNVSVVVGYTANYAIYVHENLEAHHEVGQAKFLEQPARELGGPGGVLGQIVLQAKMQKKTMAQGLLLAGLRLQRESQLLVPVDTGNLKAGAFTELETGTPPPTNGPTSTEGSI